tara:strand:+ start:175 stop:315 length:141 start_codon:yes stop_codon:yes gene_type:complete
LWRLWQYAFEVLLVFELRTRSGKEKMCWSFEFFRAAKSPVIKTGLF